MELAEALDLGRQALMITMVVAGPILAIGVLVGIGISLVQTVTQLHDQTLSVVPKIVAMLAAAVFFVPWLATRVLEYTQEMLGGH